MFISLTLFGVCSTQTLVEIYSTYSTLRFNFGRFKTGTFEQGFQSRSAPPLLLRNFCYLRTKNSWLFQLMTTTDRINNVYANFTKTKIQNSELPAPFLRFPNLFILSWTRSFLIRSLAMGSTCIGQTILPLKIWNKQERVLTQVRTGFDPGTIFRLKLPFWLCTHC